MLTVTTRRRLDATETTMMCWIYNHRNSMTRAHPVERTDDLRTLQLPRCQATAGFNRTIACGVGRTERRTRTHCSHARSVQSPSANFQPRVSSRVFAIFSWADSSWAIEACMGVCSSVYEQVCSRSYVCSRITRGVVVKPTELRCTDCIHALRPLNKFNTMY